MSKKELKKLSHTPYLPEQLPPLLGAFGFVGYTMIHYFEDTVSLKEKDRHPDIPDMVWMVPKDLIVIDHLYNILSLVTLCFTSEERSLSVLYNNSTKRLDNLISQIQSITSSPPMSLPEKPQKPK